MDENKLINEQNRAHLAKQIEDNPVWIDAWERYIDGIWNSWKNTAPDDVAARERAYIALKVAASVRKEIRQVIVTGKMAEQVLGDLNERTRTNH